MKKHIEKPPLSNHDYYWITSPLSKQLQHPITLAYCSLIIVKQGQANLSIQFRHYEIQSGDILILAEDSLTLLLSHSADFLCQVCAFNRSFAAEVAYRLPNSLFTYLNQFPHFRPNAAQASLIRAWELQSDFIFHSTVHYQRIILCNHLQNFFFILAEIIDTDQQLAKNEYSRKEKLSWRFWEMVAAQSKQHREVTFYAQALNISPYYLSQICKTTFNDSAKTLIDRQVILQLKQQLKLSELSIQSIADLMHFQDPSYMCRYFKKQTGMTLRQYRKQA